MALVQEHPSQDDQAAHLGGSPRFKVLVQAYACSPCRGSEAGIGWGWAEALSRYHDLWIITAKHFEPEIEHELDRRPELRERMKFNYVERERYRLLEKVWPPAYLWSYRRQWQRAAFEVAEALYREIGFDVVHQLTYEGFRVPGYLWKLDAPFVWGPIGGLEQTNWRLLPGLGLRGLIHFTARNVLNSIHKRFLSEPKRAFQRARGGVISATAETRRQILQYYGVDSDVICEIGVPPATVKSPSLRRASEPLRLAWSGLHIPRKALPFLLHSLAGLPGEVHWELSILGSGPCTRAWKRLAGRLNLADRCAWLGSLPRDEAVSVVRQSHVFVITSVYDLTSTVIIEALAQGVPVVCPDHCGFSDVITADSGIKVPAGTPRQLVRHTADAIRRLWNDEELRRCLAGGAIRRAADFSWENKAKMGDHIYQRVVGKTRRMKDQGSTAGFEP